MLQQLLPLLTNVLIRRLELFKQSGGDRSTVRGRRRVRPVRAIISITKPFRGHSFCPRYWPRTGKI